MRNPKTGAVVVVGKKAMPYFKTGKEMRARLNRETEPSAEPTPVIDANK
jgi:integration host factor subunit beta